MGDTLFELKDVINALSKTVLSGYEWRLVMIILDETFGSDKETAEISLDDFCRKTKIKKPHVSRSLSTLQERNVVRKRIITGKMTWWINPKTETWRSYLDFKVPHNVPKRIQIAWDRWIDRYPNKILVEDAKAIYVSIVMQNGKMVEKLEDCLSGYIKMKKHQDKKFNREPDELMCMYPTTFLKNKAYEGFEKYKYLKKEENW